VVGADAPQANSCTPDKRSTRCSTDPEPRATGAAVGCPCFATSFRCLDAAESAAGTFNSGSLITGESMRRNSDSTFKFRGQQTRKLQSLDLERGTGTLNRSSCKVQQAAVTG